MDKKILKILKFKETDKISKINSVFNTTALFTDGKGFGVIINKKNKCIGVITDGDIRRGLNKFNKDDSIKFVYNKKFTFADHKLSKTAILQIFEKLINNKNYHLCLPVLDKSKKLIDILNYRNFLNEEKIPKCIRVKMPARISFVGGGTDFTEYLFDGRSYILSAAIQKYLTVSLYPRKDQKISILNYTDNTFLKFDSFDKVQKFKKNDLVINILKNRPLKFGFDLEIYSDFESKTGLGGSSILSIAILKVLNLFKNTEEIDNFQLVNEAYKSERLDTKIKGGWQDYLASTFGGFNWIDLYKSEFFVNQLSLDKKIQLELENNLILIKLGSRKSSGLIQTKQIDHNRRNAKSKNSKFNKIRDLSIQMKNYLIKGDLEKFGKSMDLSWKLKKKISPKSSNKKIDKIYNEAKSSGALGGKILGAGQSGYLLIYINSKEQQKLINNLKKLNLKLKFERINFSTDGLKFWKVF